MRLRNTILVPLLALALTARAQTPAPTTRSISLAECIQIALEHNLDLKIERFNPEVAQYNVGLAYAGYDPVFDFKGTHGNNFAPGSFDSFRLQDIPANKSSKDAFNTSLGGLLPTTGLQYSLAGNIAETAGQSLPTDKDPLSHPSDNTSGLVGLTLTQPLLKNFWIDNTRYTISVSKNRLKYSEHGLRFRIMTTVNNVELAYYSLIQARENVTNQEQALALAQQLLAENKKRVEVGALAPLDEKQAESQVAARRADLLSARSNLDTQQNALKSLLSEDFAEWNGVLLQPSETLAAPAQVFDLQASWQRGLTQRPDLLQARLDVEQQGITVRYLRNQTYPQLDVIGSYGHNASKKEYSGAFNDIGEGKGPVYAFGAELKFPLGNRAARSNYRISKAQKEQTLLRLKQAEQNVMIAIDNAVKQAQTAYQSVDATKQARVYAEAALDAEHKKLENGKSTSFQVLQLQRDLTFARSAEIQALGDYNKALAQLAFTEGATLEKAGLKIEVK